MHFHYPVAVCSWKWQNTSPWRSLTNSTNLIGLVYYQHINHHLLQHGANAVMLTDMRAEHSKYVRWLSGEFVPYAEEVKTMKASSYVFPDGIKLKPKKKKRSPPELYKGL